jgi:membrane-bound ClpP family serine protease
MQERLSTIKAQNQILSEQHAEEKKAYQERNGDVPVRHVEQDLARNDREAYARAVVDSAAQDKNYRDNWMLIDRPDHDGKTFSR